MNRLAGTFLGIVQILQSYFMIWLIWRAFVFLYKKSWQDSGGGYAKLKRNDKSFLWLHDSEQTFIILWQTNL